MVASPDYVENTIALYQQAAADNFGTAGRSGNLVDLTTELAADLMITGDLHGHRRNFNLICKIAALDENPRRHLLMQEVCHGGPSYPHNGGCMSHSVLEDIARMVVKYPGRVHFMLGNHELAEVTDYPIQKNRQMLNLLFRMGLQHMYGDSCERVREAMVAFLRSCPLAVRMPGGVFICHSVPDHLDTREFDASIFARPMDPLEFYERGEVFRLVWGRDHRGENARRFVDLMGARVVINGHEPCSEGFMAPNPYQVIVDSCNDNGCYLILGTDREWAHEDIVRQIHRLAG
jgi:hypothetical protein